MYKQLDTNNMTIVAGGDIGNSPDALVMNENTVKVAEPDLMIVGGDIAYDNGFAT